MPQFQIIEMAIAHGPSGAIHYYGAAKGRQEAAISKTCTLALPKFLAYIQHLVSSHNTYDSFPLTWNYISPI